MNLDKRKQQESDTDWIGVEIYRFQSKELYGSISLIFEGGVCVRVKCEESKIPPKALHT